MIELGSKVRDVVSGFEGTVIARAEYLYGETELLVAARTDQSASDSRWVSARKLESLDGKVGTGFAS